jgi:hypothetical protein
VSARTADGPTKASWLHSVKIELAVLPNNLWIIVSATSNPSCMQV